MKAISRSHIVVHAAVYSGSDGRLLHHLDHDQSGVSSLFVNGRSFAQLGDLDGDRIADFIGGDAEGRAFIFSGKTGSMMRVNRGTTGFGYGVYALGDLDRDGFIDYAIEEETPSAITIYSARFGEELARIEGREFRLVGIDDLNEDGTPDLAVVEDGTNLIKFVSGALRGTFRTNSLPDSLILGRYFHGENDGYIFAASGSSHTIQKVSDLDGDGFHEILVRRRTRRDFGNPRALIAISPKKAEKIWTADFGIDDAAWWNYESVGEIGDLNGDGVTEIATSLGVHPDINPLVVVISGLDGSFLYTQEFPSIARDLTVMSDLDGDGIREVAVGDSVWNDQTGRVIIYSFGPASQDLEPYRPGNPQLTVNTTPEDVTIAWPAAITDPQPQCSPTCRPGNPSSSTAPESGRFVLPGTKTKPRQYFRLQYEE
ncbi:MAG: hypothetical protein R3F19_29830 [Verrucomicrobiales bacterium]